MPAIERTGLVLVDVQGATLGVLLNLRGPLVRTVLRPDRNLVTKRNYLNTLRSPAMK